MRKILTGKRKQINAFNADRMFSLFALSFFVLIRTKKIGFENFGGKI